MSKRGGKPRVAFQGERGAFSEEAAMELLGKEIELVPRPTFELLFASIDEGVADYILAPVENSLAGTVKRVHELMLEHSFPICDEVTIVIEQHLIGCPGASLEEINGVESHPMALAQCQRFFANNPNIKAIPADDTAGSVALVIQRDDKARAAIAGRSAAELYGGVILREHVEDNPENYTRFVLLGTRHAVATRCLKLSRESKSIKES